jgi:hypothetical protein
VRRSSDEAGRPSDRAAHPWLHAEQPITPVVESVAMRRCCCSMASSCVDPSCEITGTTRCSSRSTSNLTPPLRWAWDTGTPMWLPRRTAGTSQENATASRPDGSIGTSSGSSTTTSARRPTSRTHLAPDSRSNDRSKVQARRRAAGGPSRMPVTVLRAEDSRPSALPTRCTGPPRVRTGCSAECGPAWRRSSSARVPAREPQM